jgi:hypothetical protein
VKPDRGGGDLEQNLILIIHRARLELVSLLSLRSYLEVTNSSHNLVSGVPVIVRVAQVVVRVAPVEVREASVGVRVA